MNACMEVVGCLAYKKVKKNCLVDSRRFFFHFCFPLFIVFAKAVILDLLVENE